MGPMLWLDCMKLGSGSQGKTQRLSKPGKAPNFGPGFSIYPAYLPEIPVLLYILRAFPRVGPGSFLAIPEPFMVKTVYFSNCYGRSWLLMAFPLDPEARMNRILGLFCLLDGAL
jgi:hypothetical protein